MFNFNKQSNERVIVQPDGSVRMNLDHPQIREAILTQVELARKLVNQQNQNKLQERK